MQSAPAGEHGSSIVATGPGYVAAKAAERGAEPIGVDFSDTMLAYARAHVPSVEFVHGDATALPFEDESFDAVVAAFVLLHLGSSRAGRRGGCSRAATRRPGGVQRVGRAVARSVDRRVLRGVHGCRRASPCRCSRRPELLQVRGRRGVRVHCWRVPGSSTSTVDTVEFGLDLADGDELWDGLIEGSVRVRPMILGQPEELQRTIRERFDELLEAYRTDRRARGPGLGQARRRNEALTLAVDRDRLVEWAAGRSARRASPAPRRRWPSSMRETFLDMGLQVQWQQVEDGRANVLGIHEPAPAAGRASCSTGTWTRRTPARSRGSRHVPGFQPSAFVEDGRLYGLGISNMKGALACYVEALRALDDAGVRLRGDVLIAAVSGEIEKTQWGDAQGAEFRGYAAGSRYLVSHGGVADMCILGEPTESKLVLGHFGSLWLRISTQGHVHPHRVQRGEARPELDPAHARRARRGARVDPDVGGRSGERVPRGERDRQRRCDRGRLRLARLADAAPHRSLPRRSRPADEGDGDGARRRCSRWCAGSASGSRTTASSGEVYVTAPGAEIAEEHPLVERSTRRTRRCSGRRPSATSRAGSRTPPCSPATGSRR